MKATINGIEVELNVDEFKELVKENTTTKATKPYKKRRKRRKTKTNVAKAIVLMNRTGSSFSKAYKDLTGTTPGANAYYHYKKLK